MQKTVLRKIHKMAKTIASIMMFSLLIYVIIAEFYINVKIYWKTSKKNLIRFNGLLYALVLLK